jgi:hypothetical protein
MRSYSNAGSRASRSTGASRTTAGATLTLDGEPELPDVLEELPLQLNAIVVLGVFVIRNVAATKRAIPLSQTNLFIHVIPFSQTIKTHCEIIL